MFRFVSQTLILAGCLVVSASVGVAAFVLIKFARLMALPAHFV
ncbi:hypothetical protein [Methylobacterium iners]|jgi:hypothetical protein|uniref:Uncharacterized protein n=1 Tax=Methylobacterium iners TaxID=418707 RepID=A0ABQ4S623_9HYPH|nr:hypothetical protein [Methylobacterium iners]GJD97334.1 hypothetical protein OCOJLMKI_4563 [Methylobacterium iners]